MKLNKYIVSGVIAASALCVSAGLSAQTKEEVDSYLKTFGYWLGSTNGLTELQLSEEEFAVFVKGMKEASQGAPRPENIQEIGPKMAEYLQARAQKTIDAQKAKAEEAAAEFWKELAKDPKVSKTPSGLHYEITEAGADPKPSEDSVVVVNYTGKLANGTVFDSSIERGKPEEFSLAQVIPGFREGLMKLGKGGKAKLYIPAAIGYGDQPLPGIPAGSTRVFDVELVDVKAPAAPAMPAMPAAPAAPAAAQE